MKPLTDYEKKAVQDLHAVRLSVSDIAGWMRLPKESVRETLGSLPGANAIKTDNDLRESASPDWNLGATYEALYNTDDHTVPVIE